MRLQRLVLLLLITSIGTALNAQNWTKSDVQSRSDLDNDYLPQKYVGYQLEYSSLITVLDKAHSGKSRIELPTPDGGIEVFEIEASNVFHPDLSARYPNIKAFKGYSLDVPGSYLRMGYGEDRMHAMILREGQQATYIDHIKETDQNYSVYYKNDYGVKDRHQFECFVDEEVRESEPVATARHGDCQLRKYRLALACTGEYANFHGGTVASVLAEYNVAMTRVNGLYERDAGITMELVANTDEIIFLNGGSDPYTNNVGSTMLGENQEVCDDIIGSENYDIGHVFSTGGGGVAWLDSPCGNRKAWGVTGLGSPVNDPFYIDFVSHEMGHQFGGNHTQNSNCQRNSETAFEPGSGSTIMGYAGVCSPNFNIQSNSDDHFHGISLIEIADFVTGNGNSCAEIIPTTNNAPEVSVANAVVTIPARTTFFLTANATDADGDIMTYCWEQMDNEIATMPPQGSNTGGPLFKSISPSTDSRRFFPKRTGASTWEVLPTVSRDLNFMCTVRDNNASVGCTGEVSMEVNVFNTGSPFIVTSPNTAVMWRASEIKTVTWNVSGSDQAPINATEVDIFLSVDGGETFDLVLAENTPNDGTHDIIVPDVLTDEARVVIVGNGVFYDMSDQNFSITTEFSVEIVPFSQVVCGQDELVYTANLTSIASFTDVIDLSVSGLPNGATVILSENMVTTPASVDINIAGLTNVGPGQYIVSLDAMTQNTTINELFSIDVQNSNVQAVNTITPTDGLSDVNPTLVEYTWDAQDGVNEYQFQLTTVPDFESAAIISTTTSSSIATTSDLEQGKVYYWRVRALSSCSTGEYSEAKAFRTSSDGCVEYGNNTPVAIPAENNVVVTSDVEVSDEIDFGQAKLVLDISHTWVGDLAATITSPGGVDFMLFDRPGFPSSDDGCPRNNIMASFKNDATLTAANFETSCNPNPLAISGEYQSLEEFISISSVGMWTLTVTDAFQADGGAINSWYIESCSDVIFPDLISSGSKKIIVANGGSGAFDNNILTVDSDEVAIVYVTKLPSEGVLMRGVDALVLGSVITEEELINGTVTYVHSGNAALADGFFVDVQIPTTGAWLRNENVEIDILEKTFQVVSTVTNVVSCFEGADGTILATAVEGAEPYEFSIDNVEFQSEPTFDNLPAGEYIVYVKDADGIESESDPITITQSDQIILTVDLVGYAINASAEGGAEGFEYSIDGNNFNTTGVFPDLDNGDFEVMVRDANDCIVSSSVNVDIDALIAQISTVNLDCANVNDGSLSVTPEGGIAPYEYSLNESTFGVENMFVDLPEGTYSISVKDAGGKVVEYDNLMVSAASPISFGYEVDMGAVVINAMGGAEPYMYSINGVDFQSDNVLDLDITEDYTLTISDNEGCVYTFGLSISSITSISVVAIDVCFSETSGSILINGITGGVGPYEYSINDGSFQDESVFSNLPEGVYDVTVRDANGAEYTEVGVAINENPELDLDNFTSTDTLYVNGIGGAGSGYSYSINGEGFNTDGFFTDIPDGDYTVTVMDASGCVEDFLIMFTDVDDILTDNDIKIYPNPVAESLQVELLSTANKLETITLISIDGKLIINQSQLINGNVQTVDVSKLINGLYILFVETTQGSVYQKVSVMK